MKIKKYAFALSAIVLTSCHDASPKHEDSINGKIKDNIFKSERESESNSIANNSAFARRSSDSLEILNQNKVVKTLRDSTDGKCEHWFYISELTLIDSKLKSVANYAQVKCKFGEFASYMLVEPDGSMTALSGRSYSSPNGKIVVTGSFGFANSTDSIPTGLEIMDWPNKSVVATFDASCSVQSWISDEEFNVICKVAATPSFKVFNGVTSLDGAGKWRIRIIQELDPSNLAPIPTSNAKMKTSSADADDYITQKDSSFSSS